MARPKQPIEVLLAKGNKHLTKEEIATRRKQEIKASADAIVAPSYLTKPLKKKFDDIAKQLIDLNIMSNLDCDALARYIVSENTYQKISKELIKMGAFNPNLLDTMQLQEKAFKMTRQAAQDLGLTISSRCKLVIPESKQEVKENKFNMFL